MTSDIDTSKLYTPTQVSLLGMIDKHPRNLDFLAEACFIEDYQQKQKLEKDLNFLMEKGDVIRDEQGIYRAVP